MFPIMKILFLLIFLTGSGFCDQKTDISSALSQYVQVTDDLKGLYKKNGNSPLWVEDGKWNACAKQALDVLQNADEEGLNPVDYQDEVDNKATQDQSSDIKLSSRMLSFIEHVRRGRMDPQKISHDIKFQSPKTHPVELLSDAIKDKTQCHKLRLLSPNFPAYRELKSLLATYRRFKKEIGEWPEIKGYKQLIKGTKSDEVVSLRNILAIHGDLPRAETASPSFDETVQDAVKQFQKRHLLESTGKVDQKTMKVMNQKGDLMIHKILINMERLRWLPDDLGEKYIVVNVGGYELRAYEKSELSLSIPAIVGRPSRRTPLFYASVHNVIINPSWGVPWNIFKHDKLPKILRDPGYVHRAGFTVTDSSGHVVDPEQADWESGGYHLTQAPGARNALGRIKFNIKNPYTIYLHGTPEEKLFKKPSRAFSSGCIRLKDPIQLAVWVMGDLKDWDRDDFNSAIKKGSTRTLNIPEDKIPVYFTYQTIWRGEDQLIYVSDDPYGLDKKMEKVFRDAIADDASKEKNTPKTMLASLKSKPQGNLIE